MFSLELVNDDNPYGLPLQDNPGESHVPPPLENPKDDPYYPDPYA